MRNNRGAVLIIALLVMTALSVIGVMSVITSSTEVKISGNAKFAKQTFYSADAGIEHVRGIIKNRLGAEYAQRLAMKTDPYDLLDDMLEGATADNPEVLTIDSASIGTCTYSVWIRDNNDGGGVTPDEQACTDTDRRLYARSVASGPFGSASSLEIFLEASLSGDKSLFGYTAQAGGGVGKNYNADDVSPISDFTGQMSGVL